MHVSNQNLTPHVLLRGEVWRTAHDEPDSCSTIIAEVLSPQASFFTGLRFLYMKFVQVDSLSITFTGKMTFNVKNAVKISFQNLYLRKNLYLLKS